jgi:hypothetical protein
MAVLGFARWDCSLSSEQPRIDSYSHGRPDHDARVMGFPARADGQDARDTQIMGRMPMPPLTSAGRTDKLCTHRLEPADLSNGREIVDSICAGSDKLLGLGIKYHQPAESR